MGNHYLIFIMKFITVVSLIAVASGQPAGTPVSYPRGPGEQMVKVENPTSFNR